MEAYEESGMLEEDNVSQTILIFWLGIGRVGMCRVRGPEGRGWLSTEDMEAYEESGMLEKNNVSQSILIVTVRSRERGAVVKVEWVVGLGLLRTWKCMSESGIERI